MTIAWTALLHSHFEKQKTKYFYKKPNGRYETIDGELKTWELGESVKHVFDENDPIRKNIELFVKLRNKLEHRNLPGVDPELIGECQALVLNFENWLIEKAVEKITKIPADLFGFKDRGVIKEGKIADISLFDKNFEIKSVIVGGKKSYSEGIFYDSLGGSFYGNHS